MIFLGIAIPIGILLGLLLFFSGLYNRNRLAAAASGGLDMFTTNFENQLDSVENYLLNLSLNDATFRSLSEQTDRTRAYLDAYEIAQGFPAVLAANDTLMGVVLRSGSGNLYVGRYGAAAQQLILLLSRYLRYILSFTATTTPLHTEIEQCCNYAELSSVGQNDPVEVVCEIDPELSELPLPPVSALDVSIQAQILNLLMDLQDEKKLTYVFITHDLSVVKHISHEIMVMYLGQCVEYAKTEDLFKNPLHPYTKGLLDAVPIPSLKAKKLSTEVMRGELTSPVDPAPGCRFAARCPYATDACRGRDIPLKEVEPGHFVSCTRF